MDRCILTLGRIALWAFFENARGGWSAFGKVLDIGVFALAGVKFTRAAEPPNDQKH